VLVVRGWLPAADGLRPDLASGWPADWQDRTEVRVEGTLIPPATGKAGQPLSVESRGREHLVIAGVDVAVIADRLPYPVLPHVIRLGRGARDAAVLEQPPEVAPNLGNHFTYAIQWFAFAVISLVGTGILIRKDGRS
jgi:cytochrome oxidase assembly protein ShyY1